MLDDGLLAQPAMKDLLRTKRSLIRGQHRVEDVHQNTWLKSGNYQAGEKQMKPTTEQIIDWGRTALNETGASIPTEWNMKLLEAICFAAYEAGRKDENEACAVIAFNAKTYLEAAAAIRARGDALTKLNQAAEANGEEL